MTFTAVANAGVLAKTLAMAARVSPRGSQTTLPILNNVKLSARDLHLVVEGTDMDRRIELAVAGAASGEITASAERLAAITKELDPDGDVKLTVTDGVLTLTQGRARMKLPTIVADDFPPPGETRDPFSVEVATPPLIAALKAVMGAIDPADARPYLRGVAFDSEGKTPMLVASNAKVMSVSPVPFVTRAKAPTVLIPIEAIGTIVDVCSHAEIATLLVSPSSFSVKAAGITFWTKVIDQNPIQWRRLIRKSSQTIVQLRVVDIARVVRRTEATGLRAIRLEMGETVRTMGEANTGQSANSVDDAFAAVEIIGDPKVVTLPTRDLRWVVSSFPQAETLEVGVDDTRSSVEFRDLKGDPEDVRVVMPWLSK